VVTDISKVAPEEWDACALEAAGEGARNPFLSHAFLLSLEESKSAVKVGAQEGVCFAWGDSVEAWTESSEQRPRKVRG
jgi:predicted N-acyltransferase